MRFPNGEARRSLSLSLSLMMEGGPGLTSASIILFFFFFYRLLLTAGRSARATCPCAECAATAARATRAAASAANSEDSPKMMPQKKKKKLNLYTYMYTNLFSFYFQSIPCATLYDSWNSTFYLFSFSYFGSLSLFFVE